jgi:hypothetical protein
MKIKQNNFTTDNNFPYSLHNVDNYKKNIYNTKNICRDIGTKNDNSNKNIINDAINDILNKYILLITDYIRLITEKIYIKKMQYYKFIFIRGLDTITTVFKILLLFTKNIDVTYYHSQKAFYFYVEFIEQISNDQNTFLNLSSREACMFVYKKTIFEINNDIKKNMNENNEEEKRIFSLLDNHLSLYKNIVYFCIQHQEFDYDKINYMNNCLDELKSISNQLNNVSLFAIKEKIECVYLFINILLEHKITVIQFFEICKLFITKIVEKKTFITCKKIQNKTSNNEFIDKMNNANICIAWLFQ